MIRKAQHLDAAGNGGFNILTLGAARVIAPERMRMVIGVHDDTSLSFSLRKIIANSKHFCNSN